MLFAVFFVFRPMILLAIGVAILHEHTCLARLETNASLLAALGAAASRRIMSIHRSARQKMHCCGLSYVRLIMMDVNPPTASPLGNEEFKRLNLSDGCPDHKIDFPFGIDEPGDTINIFREERRKFFSRHMQGQAAKGALFYFPPRGGDMKRINIEDIEENTRLAASIMGAYDSVLGEMDDVSVVGEMEDVQRFNEIIEENAIEMYQDDNYDAFRIVARELFFESKHMRDVLYKMINMADVQDFCRDCALGVDFDNIY
jgi:hypothetical protein